MMFFFRIMTAFCALKDLPEGFVKVTVPFGHVNIYLETVNYLEGRVGPGGVISYQKMMIAAK